MLRKGVYIGLSLLVAGLMILSGLRLAGPTSYPTGLGKISIQVHPALDGRAEFYAPIADWGVRVHLWSSPVRVRIEPRGLDREALLLLGKDPSSGVKQVEKEIRRAVWMSSLWSLFWVVVVAGVGLPLGFWITRKMNLRTGWAFLPSGAAVIASLMVLGGAWISFDPGAVRHPTYWARGDELPQLLRFVNRADQASDSYQGSVQNGIQQLAGILSGKPAGVQSNEQAWLMSDLHNNVLSLKIARKLVGKSPLFFVGDFAHEGNEAEQELLLPALKDLGNPMIAVSGNHDSLPLMKKIAAEGAVVLTQWGRLGADGQTDGNPVYMLGKTRIMGFQDPLQEAKTGNTRNFSLSQEEKDSVAREWAAKVRRYRPDIVLVHQSGIAEAMAGRLRDLRLVILTGHDHMQHVARYGKTVVVDAGTVGAGGLLGAGRQWVGLGRIFLQGDLLQAVDLLRLEPIRGGGQAQRVLLDQSCRPNRDLPGRCDYSLQDSADIP